MAILKNFQMIAKATHEKNNFNKIDAWWIFSIEFLVIMGAAIPRAAPCGTLQIKDYKITDHTTKLWVSSPQICKPMRINELILRLWER